VKDRNGDRELAIDDVVVHMEVRDGPGVMYVKKIAVRQVEEIELDRGTGVRLHGF
jgi:hypothetical protein